MSKPTEKELITLRRARDDDDDEQYHKCFDAILEARLDKLDPEWMEAMRDVYQKSDMARWCA